jgi:hypothetical protein
MAFKRLTIVITDCEAAESDETDFVTKLIACIIQIYKFVAPHNRARYYTVLVECPRNTDIKTGPVGDLLDLLRIIGTDVYIPDSSNTVIITEPEKHSDSFVIYLKRRGLKSGMPSPSHASVRAIYQSFFFPFHGLLPYFEESQCPDSGCLCPGGLVDLALVCVFLNQGSSSNKAVFCNLDVVDNGAVNP